MSDMLIRGGLVFDGTGAPGQKADIRLQNGRIHKIGQNLPTENAQIIEADGAIIAPGFIDSHTHLDASLFWDPLCDPMPQHGVTTVLIGNCSLGFAPLRKDQRKSHADLFSYVEDIPFDALDASIPWNWESFDEYMQHLRTMPTGVHVSALVGHSQLRHYVIGEDAWKRGSTAAEAHAVAAELDRALSAGALGLSSSLFDKSREGDFVPSYYAFEEDGPEIDLIFETLGKHGAIFQFIPRSRTVDTTLEDLRRVGALSAKYNVRVLHNVLSHNAHDPQRCETILACVNEVHAQGGHIYSMVTPRPFELLINFNQTLCFIGIKAWNDLVQAKGDAKYALARDPEWRARARPDFDNCQHKGLFPVDRLHDLRIVTVGKEHLESWVGKSLKDLVTERGGHPSDVMADWVLENDFEATFVNPAGNTIPAGVAGLLKSDRTFVSASDAGAHLQMFSGAGDTTLLLTRYVRERGDFDLPTAIHFLTGRQAMLLGLKDRGRIAEGLAADLVIFNLDELHYGGEEVVQDVPNKGKRFTRAPGGFRYTIANGVITQQNGKATGALPAGVLTKSA